MCVCVIVFFICFFSVDSSLCFLSQKKYRQKVDNVKFTQVADTLSIKHAKKSQELQSKVRLAVHLL